MCAMMLKASKEILNRTQGYLQMEVISNDSSSLKAWEVKAKEHQFTDERETKLIEV